MDSGVDFSTKGLSTKSKSLRFIDKVLRKNTRVNDPVRNRLLNKNPIKKNMGPNKVTINNSGTKVSFNPGDSSTIAYNGTLNSIHAFNNLTV